MNKIARDFGARTRKVLSIATALAFVAAGIQAPAAQAATATINNVSFKAPVFDSYDHSTGGGVWNDGSVTYDKGELLGTNYKCGDIATFLLELNTSATPTKQPAPYKAQISINYTWDSTGATGASLTALSSPSHLRVNTGVIKNASGTTIGGATGTSPAGVPAGWDSGFNSAGTQALVATSPAPVVTPTGSEFGGNSSSSNVTFTVENILAGGNIIVRSDAVIHCKPNSSPTGNLQAALMSVNVTSPGAAEVTSTGNQTVNFRGVGNLGGLGAILSITKSISSNGTDCSSTVASTIYSSGPQTVLYCYTITNSGTADATGVLVKDDHGTPGSTGDDITLTLRDTDGVTGTALSDQTKVLAGTTVYSSVSYSVSATQTNIATATSTNAATVTASASVTIGSAPVLSVVKSQTSANPAQAGDVITYSIVITNNTGNSSNTTLYDPGASTITCGPNTATTPSTVAAGVTVPLANTVGATYTCSVTHVVTSAEYSSGSYSNQAYVDKPNSNSRYYSNTVVTPMTTRPLTYDMSIVKTQTSTTLPAAAGDTIVYNILVSNTGTGALTNVTLVDNLSNTVLSNCKYQSTGTPSATLPIATFAVGSSFACTATHTVQANEVGTTVVNTATASATQTLASTNPSANNVSSAVSTPVGAQPLLKVLKIQATGSAPARVGSLLTYGISVSNAGNVAISGVNVTDPNATLSNCKVGTTPWVQGSTLLVGQVIDCDASHAVTAGDLTAGSVLNIAYATGTYGSTPLSAQSENVRSFGALSIVKTRTDNIANLVLGSVITYNITVTNTGDIALTNVAITDANASPSACNVVATLAVGASTTCAVSHTVTSTDVSNHQVSNTAAVTTSQTDPIDSNTVLALITESGDHITIVKSRTSAAQVTAVGQTITYSIVATNTGSTHLHNVEIADAYATLGTCGVVADLAPLATVTCTASHVVTSADATAGHYDNVATATTTENSNGSSNSTTSNHVDTPIVIPSLTIVKSRVGTTDLTTENDVVTYQIVVTNTGNVQLTNVVLTDTNAALGTCSNGVTFPATLAVQATITCSATHSVTAGEVTARQVLNTANVTTDQIASTDSNQVLTPVTPPVVGTPLASLAIAKSLTGIAPIKVGQAASYIITVTNNGDVTLTGVTVTDANAVLGACSVALPATLAVGASLTCAATHVVTDADMAAGKVDNTALASATTGSLSRTSNVVTVPLAPAPALTIVKSLSGNAPSKVGDTITYNIVVTNSGNVTVSSVTVADANAVLGACSPATPATLAPAATISCEATHVVTEADMAAGKVDNVAAATGTAAAGTLSASSGSSATGTPGALNVTSNVVTVPLTPAPAITISKHVTGSLPTTIGGFLHYIIVVTNTGNVPLHDVTVGDDNATITSCSPSNPASTLAIGDRITCSAKHALTEADAAAGKVINVATVSTKENVSASSGSEATGGASSNPSDPSTVNKSNEVVTPIIFKQQTIGKGTKAPGTIVLNLAGTKLKNPKLKQLAFTGGEEPATSDYGFFGALMILMALVLGARRWAKR